MNAAASKATQAANVERPPVVKGAAPDVGVRLPDSMCFLGVRQAIWNSDAVVVFLS